MKKILKRIYKLIPFKRQVFTIVKRFYIPKKNIYQHLPFKGFFKVKVEEDKSFKLFHSGVIQENEIFWSGLEGGWEKKSIQLWQILAKDAKIIFDIGANTGVYGLVAQCVNSSSKVFCFEPLPEVFAILSKNIQENNYLITPKMLALSNYTGTANVYLNRGESFAYSVTVNKNTLNHTNFDELEIQTTTLTEFIEKNNLSEINLMKIDVEGHELEVIAGMDKYLDLFKPSILIEVLTKEMGVELTKVFDNMNYLYFNIDDDNNSVRQTDSIEKSDFWNYLVCSEQTARKLELI